MRLFNKTIDRQLFKQYALGSDLSKQKVVAKIFNPYGAGLWFILNSDPQDPDYLWAIVDLGYGAEVGSVSRSDLENYRGRFGMGFERDLSFDPINALELYNGLSEGKYYAKGGAVDKQSIEEEIRSLNSRIKSLSEINTKEASEQVKELVNSRGALQARLLHIEDSYAKGGVVKEPKNEKQYLSLLEISALNVKEKYLELKRDVDALKKKANFLQGSYNAFWDSGIGIKQDKNKYDLSYSLYLKLDNAYYNISRNDIESDINESLELISKLSGKFADGGGVENKPYIFFFYDENGNEQIFKTLAEATKEAKKQGQQKVRDNLGGEYFINYADGGELVDYSDNQRMIMNQNVQLEHHHEELEDILEDKMPVPAWVVAKMATATESVSDVTHYLDGEKELMEDENEDENEEEDEDQDEIENKIVVEPIDVSAGTKTDLTKNFTDEAMGNLRGFLKGMEGIDLRDDYTFDYKDEQYEVEPIINSDENGVSNAVFTIFDGDGEEVGDVAYSRNGGKQKFTANSEFFSWNNAKFEDGGFMNGNYADGGVFDSIFPSGTEVVSGIYRTNVGIMAITDVKNINGYDWHIVTKLPNYEGGLYSFAYAGKFNTGKLIPFYNYLYTTTKDPMITLYEDKIRPIRNSEKKVEKQHLLALEIFKEKMKKGKFEDGGYFDGTIPKASSYMSNYAKGGSMNKHFWSWRYAPNDDSYKSVVIYKTDVDDENSYDSVEQIKKQLIKEGVTKFIEEESKRFWSWKYAPNDNSFKSVIIYKTDIDDENSYDSVEQIKEQLTKEGVNKFIEEDEENYAKGGEVAKGEILGLKRNFMGTTDVEMKISGMRKPQRFSVYPIGKDDSDKIITIQSETRIGKIDLSSGRGLMSQSHSNGAYFVHFQMDKLTPFTISESDLEELKMHIFKTAGDNVGSRGIVSDNSGASSVYADGGKIDNKDLEKLNAYWQSFYKGIMAGKKDEGYITITNKDELNKYITSKLGNVVKNIELIEKGKNYPYNDSYPYYEDIYSVELKNGTTFKIVRSYGRPRWQGNVDYKEQIIVENIKQYADGGDLKENLYPRYVIVEKKDVPYFKTLLKKIGIISPYSEDISAKQFNIFQFAFYFNNQEDRERASKYYHGYFQDGGFMNNVYADGGNVEKPLTRFRVGESFRYKNNGSIIYTVIKVYNDGACEARDEEGDNYSFEFDELNELVKAENNYAKGGLNYSLVPGTSGIWLADLPHSKYKITKEVSNAQASAKNNETYVNIVLPKGSIVNNLKGGVFVESEKLKEIYSEIYNEKYGLRIIKKRETLNEIYNNSEILEYADGGFINDVYAKGGGLPSQHYYGMGTPYKRLTEEEKEDLRFNNYNFKSAKQVWGAWTVEQQQHFLKDHIENNVKHQNYIKKEGDNLMFKAFRKYEDLPTIIKAELIEHIKKGQYAKGGMVVTSIKDIPNFKERLEQRRITYRGLGMGKVADDFYKLAGTGGTRIKVDGKEYFITDKEFDTFSRGADGKMQIRFDAPARKGYADGGEIKKEMFVLVKPFSKGADDFYFSYAEKKPNGYVDFPFSGFEKSKPALFTREEAEKALDFKNRTERGIPAIILPFGKKVELSDFATVKANNNDYEYSPFSSNDDAEVDVSSYSDYYANGGTMKNDNTYGGGLYKLLKFALIEENGNEEYIDNLPTYPEYLDIAFTKNGGHKIYKVYETTLNNGKFVKYPTYRIGKDMKPYSKLKYVVKALDKNLYDENFGVENNYSDGGFMNNVYAKGGTIKKYIDHADIKTVTVKRNGKEVTYKGADVLNGANILAKGGDISSKANYIPRRDVVEVELKDGSKVKPANGYWIKKGAEPITSKQEFTSKDLPKDGSEIKITAPKLGNFPEIDLTLKYDSKNFRFDIYEDGVKKDVVGEKEVLNNLNSGIYVFTDKSTPTASGKSETKVGETYIRKDMRGNWKAETNIDNFNDYDWRLSTIKTYSGKLITSAQGGKTEPTGSKGYEIFKYTPYEDPNYTLEVSSPKRLTDKVVSEQHVKGLAKFKKFMETGMFRGGGKISKFDKLSDKVAKEYEGKPVKSEYQEEYGKYYSKAEAQEVGDKVAGKVKAMQMTKK